MSPSKKPSRGKKGGTPQGGAARRKFPYTPAERLRVVKLHLEEGLPRSLIVEETGIAADTLGRWIRSYQRHGEAGRVVIRPSGTGPIIRIMVQHNEQTTADAMVQELAEQIEKL